MKLKTTVIIFGLLSTPAFAETIEYTATIGSSSSCTISNIQNGVLVTNGMPEELESWGTGGTNGSFSVTMSSTGFQAGVGTDSNTISVAATSGGPAPTMDSYSTSVTVGGLSGFNTTINGKSYQTVVGSSLGGAGTYNAEINFGAYAQSSWPDGTYTFTQEIICAPV